MRDDSLVMFDLGNVVLNDIDVLDKIVAAYNIESRSFYEEYRAHENDLMTGDLDTRQYVSYFNKKFSCSLPNEVFGSLFTPKIDEQVKQVILQLRAKGQTVICASNTFADHWDVIERLGVFDLFDRSYASHIIKSAKPDPLFFSKILESEGKSPGQCLFIDDLKENVVSAQEMGIESLWYVDDDLPKHRKLKTFLS
ncbi:MAG: HAD family hydrolase [Sphaerochaetaceae bacterium]